MEKKAKVIILFFSVAIVVAVSFVFYHCFIYQDYYVVNKVDCDPALESCLSEECVPADDVLCPENITDRTSYYKFVEKQARDIF